MNDYLPEFKLPRNKAEIESKYAETLAPFATKFPRENSRAISEDDSTDNRGAFQRDRDRILHTKAFRKLMYKTQVFVNHEGDHFRTRLTHTLEVSQFARGICKSLALNEDLAESIALGHDLGHTPFGHAVEKFFREKFKGENLPPFSHNAHSVRVVDFLEKRQKDKDGLNLTYEVREGILKHNDDKNIDYPELNPDFPCSSLEGQIVAMVDTVAYICHDLEDGIKSGIIESSRKNNLDIDKAFKELVSITKSKTGIAMTTDKYDETFFIRELIHYFIKNLTNNSFQFLHDNNVKSLEDVQCFANQNKTLICFSEEDKAFFKKFKDIIYKNVYGSQTVKTMDKKAEEVVSKLFDAYKKDPQLMPPEWFYKHKYRPKNENSAITICDFISSLTDRSVLDEYERMFNPSIKI